MFASPSVALAFELVVLHLSLSKSLYELHNWYDGPSFLSAGGGGIASIRLFFAGDDVFMATSFEGETSDPVVPIAVFSAAAA